MRNKKKYAFIISISIVFLSFIIFLPFLLFLIEVKNELDYYEKCNWNISTEDFYNSYYPEIINYFKNELESYDYSISSDTYGEKTRIVFIENEDFKIKLIIESLSNVCKFSGYCYYYFETSEYTYLDVKFLDDIFTKFAIKSFYDYSIDDGLVFDIYDQNKKSNNYHYYFDNGVGNLGCDYYFGTGNVFSLDVPYVFYFSVISLFRDSDDYIERIKS